MALKKIAAAGVLALTLTLVAGFWWGRLSVGPIAETGALAPPTAGVGQACPTPGDGQIESPQLSSTPLCKSRYSGMGPVDLLALPTDFEQTVALYTVAAEASITGLQDLIGQAMSIPIEGERDAALSILYMRYSDLDPDGSIEHLYRMGLQGHPGTLFVMFNGWAKTDLDGAIARTGKLKSPADRRQANNAILRAHASEDPVELAAIEARLTGQTGSFQAQALAQRARSEPLAAMATAMSIADPRVKRQAIRWIASVWVDHDAAAALAYGEQIADLALRKDFRGTALVKLAQNDPLAALKRVGQGNADEDQAIITNSFAALTSRNPHLALAQLPGLKTPAHRTAALQALVNSWAQSDPAGAALALESMSDLSAEQRQRLGLQVSFAYAQRDPAGALAWAERLEGHQGTLWNTAINAVAQSDPQLAMAVVGEMPASAQQAEMLTSLIGNLALNDPALAIAQLASLPEGELQARAVRQIANAWVKNDPIATMDWLTGLPQQVRGMAMQNLAWQFAAIDPLLAASYVDEVTGPARSQWINAVLNQFAQKDPREAATWLEQYSEEREYGNWMGTVASAYAKSDPRAGAKLLARLNPEQFQAAIPQFISAWAQHDPQAAGKYWHRMKPAQQNEVALLQLVGTWQRFDPAGTEKWVRKLSNSNHRDQALATLVSNDNSIDKATARRIIEDIESPDIRLQAYTNQLWQLARYDRDQAEQWIRSARLSTAERDGLLAQLEQIESIRH